jgi:hypothetical protein
MKGFKDRDAACIEVEKEAGVIGSVRKKPTGSFQYWKRQETPFELLEAVIYIVNVSGCQSVWKEQAVRRVQWMSLDDAAHVVDEPGPVALLQSYMPKVAGRPPA